MHKSVLRGSSRQGAACRRAVALAAVLPRPPRLGAAAGHGRLYHDYFQRTQWTACRAEPAGGSSSSKGSSGGVQNSDGSACTRRNRGRADQIIYLSQSIGLGMHVSDIEMD